MKRQGLQNTLPLPKLAGVEELVGEAENEEGGKEDRWGMGEQKGGNKGKDRREQETLPSVKQRFP